MAASASGTYAHYRLGNVDFKMGIYLLIGGVIGGTGGVQIIRILRQMGNADFLVKITYVIMLGFVGGYMLLESLQGLRSAKGAAKPVQETCNSAYSRFIRGRFKGGLFQDVQHTAVVLQSVFQILLVD